MQNRGKQFLPFTNLNLSFRLKSWKSNDQRLPLNIKGQDHRSWRDMQGFVRIVDLLQTRDIEPSRRKKRTWEQSFQEDFWHSKRSRCWLRKVSHRYACQSLDLEIWELKDAASDHCSEDREDKSCAASNWYEEKSRWVGTRYRWWRLVKP